MGRRLATFLGAVLLIGLVASQALAHDEKVQAQLIDEVLRMTEASVPEDIILKQIAAWGFEFELSADDIVELRSLGVSDAVIAAMVDTGHAAGYDDKEPQRNLYVSAGFYSPWYAYPYAWSFYYDPFPYVYSAYYYPIYYHAPYFGHYGWSGCTYYYAYHRGVQPRPGAGSGGSIYVASHLPAQPAPGGVRMMPHAPGGGGVVRPTDGTGSTDPSRGWIASRRSRQLAPATAPYGSRRAGQAAFGRGRIVSRRGSVSMERPGVAREAQRIERSGVLRLRQTPEGRSWIPRGAEARSIRNFTPRSAGSSPFGGRSFTAPRGFQPAQAAPRMSAPAAAFRGRIK
jgi:hypothetical protein